MNQDQRKIKILVVDDDTDICELMENELARHGYIVAKAFKGNDAFKIIVKDHVDIVISDVSMPKGDGLKLLEKINQLTENKPVVIMISGLAGLSKKEFIERGATDLILKPIDFEDLIQQLNAIAARILTRERKNSQAS